VGLAEPYVSFQVRASSNQGIFSVAFQMDLGMLPPSPTLLV
jgi:hypothetical protein